MIFLRHIIKKLIVLCRSLPVTKPARWYLSSIILNSAVERMHMVQALDSPGESEESLITNEVTAFSSNPPCKPISCTSHTRSTAEFRIIFAVALPLLLAAAFPALAASRQNNNLEYQVKAVYLYNFIRFIDIPDKQGRDSSAEVKICILGQDPFESSLSVIASQRPRGRALNISRIFSVERGSGCHVLFISNSESGRLNQIMAHLKHSGTLTVGEMPQFARHGGVIGFVIKKNRVRLEINLDVARREGLKISANLLEVATIVE